MSKQKRAGAVREVVGIFFDSHSVEDAIHELKAKGFPQNTIGLLASEGTVKEKLNDLFAQVNQTEESDETPRIAFIPRKSVGDVFHGLLGSLVLFGATAVGGAVVVSTGLLASALVTAGIGAAAVLGVGAILEGIIYESDAEYLEEQIDMGHILLFVRTFNKREEELALNILSVHAAYDAKTYSVKQSQTAQPRHSAVTP